MFEPVKQQSVATPAYKHPQAAAKAAASKTNPGSVARGDKLAKARPDLAEKVRKGEVKPAEAHRQMKKAQVAEKVAALPPDKFRVIYAKRAQTMLGRCLKVTEKNAGAKGKKGGGTRGTKKEPRVEQEPPTLADLGVSKRESADAQALCRILHRAISSPVVTLGCQVAPSPAFAPARYRADLERMSLVKRPVGFTGWPERHDPFFAFAFARGFYFRGYPFDVAVNVAGRLSEMGRNGPERLQYLQRHPIGVRLVL